MNFVSFSVCVCILFSTHYFVVSIATHKPLRDGFVWECHRVYTIARFWDTATEYRSTNRTKIITTEHFIHKLVVFLSSLFLLLLLAMCIASSGCFILFSFYSNAAARTLKSFLHIFLLSRMYYLLLYTFISVVCERKNVFSATMFRCFILFLRIALIQL